MRTQDGDQIIINIVGHDPDGAINATMIQYMRDEAQITQIYGWPRLHFILGKTVRQWRPWPGGIAKEKVKPDGALPCPKCRGMVGHRINCPDGIAFSHPKEQ